MKTISRLSNDPAVETRTSQALATLPPPAAAREAMPALGFVVLQCQAHPQIQHLCFCTWIYWVLFHIRRICCFFFFVYLKIKFTLNFVIIRKPLTPEDFTYCEIPILWICFWFRKAGLQILLVNPLSEQAQVRCAFRWCGWWRGKALGLDTADNNTQTLHDLSWLWGDDGCEL